MPLDANPLDQAASARERWTAFLRFLAFIGLALVLTATAFFIASNVFKLHVDVDAAPPLWIILAGQVALVLFTVVIPTGLMLALKREPARVFGWGGPGRRRQMLIGLSSGLVLFALMLGVIAALGGVSLSHSPLSAAAALQYGLGYAVIFALTGLSEEGFVRGYGLVQLSRAISFWPAAIVTSLIFVAMHLGHKTENPLGLLQVGLFGMLMAFSFRRTGGLAFALGFHAAWDFAETWLFGVPDSGMTSAGSLLSARFIGPVWLTGGTAGPEGSVLVFPLLLLAGLLILVVFPRPRH